MHDNPLLESKQQFARVAVVLVLGDSVLVCLTREWVLKFDGDYRQVILGR
jgi:hypothetical protein